MQSTPELGVSSLGEPDKGSVKDSGSAAPRVCRSW